MVRTVALERFRDPPSRADSDVDLFHALNAMQGRKEVDLWVKLIKKAAVAERSILPMWPEAKIPRSAQME